MASSSSASATFQTGRGEVKWRRNQVPTTTSARSQPEPLGQEPGHVGGGDAGLAQRARLDGHAQEEAVDVEADRRVGAGVDGQEQGGQRGEDREGPAVEPARDRERQRHQPEEQRRASAPGPRRPGRAAPGSPGGPSGAPGRWARRRGTGRSGRAPAPRSSPGQRGECPPIGASLPVSSRSRSAMRSCNLTKDAPRRQQGWGWAGLPSRPVRRPGPCGSPARRPPPA